jgi:hypothetical protein
MLAQIASSVSRAAVDGGYGHAEACDAVRIHSPRPTFGSRHAGMPKSNNMETARATSTAG